MDVEHNTEMTCPACKFTGGFKQARPRFWVSDVWHWLVELNQARRTLVCPECGTSVTSPSGRWMPYIIMLLIVAAGIVGAIAVSMFAN
jgi:hypothetical protein